MQWRVQFRITVTARVTYESVAKIGRVHCLLLT